ncbi:hypothetical protein DVH24_031037 [Malus domestica]|uniref:Uncharacterized protein n=1 Tax=Malus domestica TaxID=3750 RepID=A0A498HEI5_MALDO|nr:hypothetical protein DVH24_031037 [Malus domestica]
MEVWEEELEPVSPNGHYFNSSVLSVSVLAVLEYEIPIDDSQTLSLLENVFLPISPRFSSIMVGEGMWLSFESIRRVRVEVVVVSLDGGERLGAEEEEEEDVGGERVVG